MNKAAAMIARRRPSLRVAIIAVSALILVVSVAAITWNQQQYKRWLLEGSGDLRPYPISLVPERADVSPADRELDLVIIDSVGYGRLVVSMSRSEYWRSPWLPGLARERQAKVHLITRKPDDDAVQIPIKLLVKIRQLQGGRWQVTTTRELVLP